MHLDLGGIGKGYGADRMVAALVDAGATGVCVDLGGDLRVAGSGPYAGAWTVEFRVPELADRFGRLRLASGAVATSTTSRRRWTRAGVDVHHLLDPATGRASRSGVATVTVLAADGWWAEVLAKAALVAGVAAGRALLEGAGVDGALVTDDGAVHTTSGFARWCERPDRRVRTGVVSVRSRYSLVVKLRRSSRSRKAVTLSSIAVRLRRMSSGSPSAQ